MKSKIILSGALLMLLGPPVFAADKSEGEAQFLSRVRQLTLEGRRSGEGYFSPDGKKIVSSSWDKTVKIWDVKEKKL